LGRKEQEKKRDRQMKLWMDEQRRVLEYITDEEEKLAYFQKVVLPEMTKLEDKEQRTWDEHRADFDLDVLERGFESEDDATTIPESVIETCTIRYDWDEYVFSKDPADIHHLVTDRGLCYLLQQCTDRQKELLFT
jgi:hypothetical protein